MNFFSFRFRHLFVSAAFLGAFAIPAQAQFTVTFSGAGANQIPLSIADFGGDEVRARLVTSVIRADLERSGRFKLIAPNAQGITEASVINFNDWRTKGADYVAVGSVGTSTDNRVEARFRLFDNHKEAQLAGQVFLSSPALTRMSAHRISDAIYEKLTGESGVFATRIAYVMKASKTSFELHIADADGQNAQVALRSKEPIISPSWSPDGSRLAYVSFENKKPVVYVHNLGSGQRIVAANFKGSNSAPAWSPDGARLAVVLSKEGGSQIFIINADGTNARRISQTSGISTEPFFSPDGQMLYFSSDRGGAPQIYRMNVSGGEAARVTFDGSYNVSPRISPDGKSMAFITRRDGGFRLALMDLESRRVEVLTDSFKDESPSFAPNGKWILFATEMGGRGILSAVSIDGRVKQRLSVNAGDVREPAWAPFGK